MDLPSLLKTVLAASWQGSLAIVLLLLLRPFLGQRIPARWRSVLWTLVLVRLLVPAVVLPHSPASLENLPLARRPVERMEIAFDPVRGDGFLNSANRLFGQPSLSEDKSAAPTRPPTRIEPWKIAAALWLLGTGLLTGWLLGGAFRLQRRLLRDRSPVQENILRIWQSCCERVSVRQAPRLFATSAITSPALVGLFRPSLLLPRKNLGTLSAEDCEHIFLHELAHFRQRDHCVHFLQLGALCIHWFNPLLWFSFRYLRADRELAADEWALRHLSPDSRTAYGDTLLRLVRSAAAPGGSFFPRSAIGILEDGAQIRQRLLRIVAFRPHRLLGTLAGAGVVLIMAALVLGQAEKPAASSSSTSPAAASTPTPPQKPTNGKNQPVSESSKNAMLTAARQSDFQTIRKLITTERFNGATFDEPVGNQLLEQLTTSREAAAFSTLLSELRRIFPESSDLQPDDSLLQALAVEKRKDFLNLYLDSWLDPARVEKIKTGNPEMDTWLVTRANETRKKRADQAALVKAAGENDLATMRRLLDAGIDINCTASSHHTPLTWAADKNKVEAVRLLLERGANVDQPKYPGWDYTPLCLTRSVEIADLLKAHGADVQAKLYSRNTSILTYIARFGGPDMVQWMIDQGVDPKAIGSEGQNLLFEAGDEQTVDILVKAGLDINAVDDNSQTPLENALHGENPAKVVTALLKHGANPNQKTLNGWTPLMLAKDGPTVDALVAAGADINAINASGQDVLSTSYNAKPSRREALLKHGAKLTPANGAWMLTNAIFQSDEAEIKSLLAMGANPSTGTFWYGTPTGSTLCTAILVGQFKIAALLRAAGANDVGLLSEAAAQGDLVKMKQLLDAGSDANERCDIGRMPLHFAVRQGQSAAVALLLERGAKVDLFDVTGTTAFAWAQDALFQYENKGNFVEGMDDATGRKVFTEIISLIASKHPNPNYRDEKGETALMRCAESGGIFGRLPENLDINAQRPDGMTALMLAVATQPKNARFTSSTVTDGQKLEFSARGILVRALLEKHADLTLRNHTGETALDIAKKVGNEEILGMLQAAEKSR